MLYLVVEFCRSKKLAEDENLIAKFGVNYTKSCSNFTHPATGLRKFEAKKAKANRKNKKVMRYLKRIRISNQSDTPLVG